MDSPALGVFLFWKFSNRFSYMKQYNVKRDMVFQISARFDNTDSKEFIWSHLGTLFASAFISEGLAAKILDRFPGSLFAE
jgi:hypothetical protein